ncbi:VWA domain-containing protein [bacterium]|nr:VWA domain-containing protein [bacterium]
MTEEKDNIKRWRMVLGKDADEALNVDLNQTEAGMDKTLEALYDTERKGGLGPSSPNVSRWLGDIRKYFPNSVVQVMQKDALDRLSLTQMLTEPEMLETVVPDVHLVANLMSLRGALPAKSKETARLVVRKVVDDLIQKLKAPTEQAISGSLNRSSRNRRPRHNEINWHETIKRNLKHFQPEYNTIIPETRIGYGRKRKSMKDIVLCIDQSGSMGTSVVYSGIFGAVMASIPAVDTKLVVFDTSVVDMSDQLDDPVEVLFGIQLGGGTDIHKALSYCQQIIARPNDTVLVFISDLYEGGNNSKMQQKMAEIVQSGVQMVTLLALNDDGAPYYDHNNAHYLNSIGVPVFACTPNLFPDLMAAALNKQDLGEWAGRNDIKLK